MIKLKLKNPNLISFSKNKGLNCKISQQSYVEENMGLKLPAKFSLFMILSEKNNDGKLLMSVDGVKTSSEDIAHKVSEFNTLFSRVNQLAEPIFQKLKSVNDSLKTEKGLSDIFSNYDKVNKLYTKLDFMSHRNLLNDIIKSKQLETLNNVTSEYHAKSLRSAFNDFILLSNKLSHGELLYWYPEGKIVLESRNSKGDAEYSELTLDSLNSYSDCAMKLDKYLTKMLG